MQVSRFRLMKFIVTSSFVDSSYLLVFNIFQHQIAFGPPGKFNSKGVSSSDTNVSIIVNKVGP